MYILHAVALLGFSLPAAAHDGVDIRRAGARPLQLTALCDALDCLCHRRNRDGSKLRLSGMKVTVSPTVGSWLTELYHIQKTLRLLPVSTLKSRTDLMTDSRIAFRRLVSHPMMTCQGW